MRKSLFFSMGAGLVLAGLAGASLAQEYYYRRSVDGMSSVIVPTNDGPGSGPGAPEEEPWDEEHISEIRR